MPVLVDTCVWVQHFRQSVPELSALLVAGEVVAHSVILGEIAVGNLKDRAITLADLKAHPLINEARTFYSLEFIEKHRLYGLGLSWGDAQLLAAADLSGIPIWTFDQRLQQQASALNLSWSP